MESLLLDSEGRLGQPHHSRPSGGHAGLEIGWLRVSYDRFDRATRPNGAGAMESSTSSLTGALGCLGQPCILPAPLTETQG
jgi:hypothetical protein